MLINKVEICGVNTSKLPILSNDEKTKLLDRIKNGDMTAREEFVKGNLRLVLSVIQRFNNRGENVDDLFQVGCIGLIKALDNFDTTLNVKFSTYAVPMIIGELRRYLRDYQPGGACARGIIFRRPIGACAKNSCAKTSANRTLKKLQKRLK